MSFRRLGVERIDLFQLHRIDEQVALEDQIGLLRDLQQEGKVRHIGLSEVSVAQLEESRRIAGIATVQNRYNLVDRGSEAVLEHCGRANLGFIPWFPVATGELARPGSPLAAIAEEIGATPAQLALAWLLRRSAVMLPIPGTSSVEHLEENIAAATVRLSDAQYDQLSSLP